MPVGRWWTASAALVVVLTAWLFVVGAPAPSTAAVAGINPVRLPLGGHPANSGFLVFVEDDVTLNADESEGTLAMGGDLTIASNYNVAAGSVPVDSTFTAPNDSGPTFLYVGGGLTWANPNSVVNIENNGFTKIAQTSTYTAFNTDNNNANVNYRIVPQGSPYNVNPHIDGRTHAQTPASIATPVPSSLIDVPAAFGLYRDTTQQLASCAETVTLTTANGDPLGPIGPGDQGYLTLEPGVTNVLELTADELDDLASLTFRSQPSASAPLLVNVTGTSFDGNFPNLAGIGGAQAPYILWNFANATSINVTEGGATVEGTLYAPNADLRWRPSQNIEGNVIAADFTHGPTVAPPGQVREVHDFPFATTLTCVDATPTETRPDADETPTETPTETPDRDTHRDTHGDTHGDTDRVPRRVAQRLVVRHRPAGRGGGR